MTTTAPIHTQNPILSADMDATLAALSSQERDVFKDATILVTGCGGFLGFAFLHFFARHAETLGIKKLVALDNFITGQRAWLTALLEEDRPWLRFYPFDIITDDIGAVEGAAEADLVVHLASIASPSFYRRFPIETVDANVTGLRKLLDFYATRTLRGFLFFSSSEIYGDPFPEFIPTREDYRGNVATIGPRACYDEAKRFGETLCYLFAEKHGLPLTMVRPFNNYGPGMNPDDKRLPADFAKAVLQGRDLEIFSDGTPTRTFCYIGDALTGYLKALVHGRFDVFNIGTEKPELSVVEFADLFVQAGQELFGYTGAVRFQPPPEKDYLTDNPNRRCPDIAKARAILNYHPHVHVAEGVKRYLQFLAVNQQQP